MPDETARLLAEIEELKRLCIRHVVEAREAATMAERERCAKLADEYKGTPNPYRDPPERTAGYSDAAFDIAEAIRNR